MAAACGKSQRYHGKQPRRRCAVHRDRIKLTEWPATKAEEVNRTDADKKAQPHRKQASAKRSQTRSPEKVVRIASAVVAEIGAPLLLSRLVLAIRSTRTNIQSLHREPPHTDGALSVRLPLRMPTPDARFESEFEIFRTEAEAATQFFFGYLALHAVAYQHRSVHALLNRAPLFWNTCLGALQTSAFIALGRVFDQQSTHNLDKVLRIGQDHPQIFSKAALARRKQGTNSERPGWLDDFMRGSTNRRRRTFAGCAPTFGSGGDRAVSRASPLTFAQTPVAPSRLQ
jgi:hypothetical protein